LPRESTSFSLLDALSESGFQASVIATYSCYFPFYEEVVLRRLLDKGCTNNILLVDAARCAEAFGSEETRPRRAGCDYTLLPIHLNGAFHPKLIVTIGKSKGALFVGSHNMTLAGFGLNDEITNEFRTGGAGARNGAAEIRATLDYLRFFLPQLTDVARVFDAVRRNAPWLEGPVAVSSNDRMLMTTTGQDKDLWSRLRPLIPKRASMVFVCGPFFDKKLSLLQRVLDDVQPKKLVVGIDPESVEIDSTAVRKFRGAEFVNIAGLPRVPNRRESGARYLHAKILWFRAPDGDLVVTGSANPSAPAFLSEGGYRNAEAVVVDRRQGTAEALGLDALAVAPSVAVDEWARVAARQAAREEDKTDKSGTLVLAIPSDNGFVLERSIGKGASLDAFAADGSALGPAATDAEDQSLVIAPASVRDDAQILRGVRAGNRPVFILVHRPEEVARNVGGDRQRELRRALGALEEDPTQLDTLLKLTEKVIFDSDDVVSADVPIRRKTESSSEKSLSSGPESLAVDAVGRRTSIKKKRIASGDILVLLDALMYRLGLGLPGRASPSPSDGEDQSGGEENRNGDVLLPPPPYEFLAETCRRKVGRLIRRMARQLELATSGSARRAIVQLAAVLSVVHALRTMEQRIEWRSKRLKLVDPDHEWQLFDEGGLAFAWGSSALGPRAMREADGEMFQELSLVSGLLAWLAWDLEIDVKAAVERTTPIDRDEEDDPWYPIQVFAAVATQLVGDREAQETVVGAVERTARKGADAGSWLTTHLALADRLVKVISQLGRPCPKLERAPRPGDLVILGSALDPRVRIALEVSPSGATGKITVLDQESDNRERQFLMTHVNYLVWWDNQTAAKRVAVR
jgi:hypothetical protein